MFECEVTSGIEAAPAVLFPFLVDVVNDTRWRQGVKDVVLVDGATGVVGATYVVTAHAPEHHADVVVKIGLDAVVADRRIDLRLPSDLATYLLSYRLEPSGRGTDLSVHISVDAPGPIARIAARSGAATMTEDLARLAALFGSPAG